MPDHTIAIATDFTRYPGPRYRKDGSFSGEQFREEVLVPALHKAEQHGNTVIVLLDGVAGYGSSFLEEAFGGLVRSGLSSEVLTRHLRIEARTPRFQHHKLRANSYIKEEAARRLLAV